MLGQRTSAYSTQGTESVAVKKVLVTTNPLNHEGGVVNYYRTFFKRWDSATVALVHLPFGSRMEHFYSAFKRPLLYPVYYSVDLLRLAWLLITDWRIRVVQVSPSLIPVPLARDAVIVLLAKVLGRSVIVFYRGWKKDVVRRLKTGRVVARLFRLVYRNADLTLVLASHFKEDLVEMGWEPSSIELTSTMYEADLILPAADRSGRAPRFLFLGRISELKGVGELVDARGCWRSEASISSALWWVTAIVRACSKRTRAHRGRGNCGPRPLCRPLDRK